MPDVQSSHCLLNKLMNAVAIGINSQPQDQGTKIPTGDIYFSWFVKYMLHKVKIINQN